jgi:hypothetical protein
MAVSSPLRFSSLFFSQLPVLERVIGTVARKLKAFLSL